ncbi:MAG: hypothetical protein ABSE99_07900 [Terracidiphilus sp.]|jgi:hypothetical protein
MKKLASYFAVMIFAMQAVVARAFAGRLPAVAPQLQNPRVRLLAAA